MRMTLQMKMKQPAVGTIGYASAPSNIALVKYWGKVRGERQIPTNSSLSMTLSDLRTYTAIEFCQGERPGDEPDRAERLLDEMCPWEGHHFKYTTQNQFPTACGIASSASGFCALVGAVSDCVSLKASVSDAEHEEWCQYWCRLGSGSSIRSLYGGFVAWEAQEAHQVESAVEFTHMVVVFDPFPKTVGSNTGHDGAHASPLHSIRQMDSQDTFERVQSALATKDLRTLTKLTEHEFLIMHAVMMTSNPPIQYMNDDCIKFCSEFIKWRDEQSMSAMVTVDAGSNPHVLFEARHEAAIRAFCERFAYVQLILNRRSDVGMVLGEQTPRPIETVFKNKVVVLSGKRYAGKTYTAERLRAPDVQMLTISDEIKRQYAVETDDVTFQDLRTNRVIKEAHRERMVEFMEKKRALDRYHWIRTCWASRDSDMATFVVTDARRPCDLEFLKRVSEVRHLRIAADDTLRARRGWSPSPTDELASECGLDGVEADRTQISEASNIDECVQWARDFFDEGRVGHGFGKLILFGEHFVVHDQPALVVALPVSTTCRLTYVGGKNGNSTGTVVDDRPAVAGYKAKKGGELTESTRLIFKEVGIDFRGWKVRFAGTLTCSSGVGSSAANCIALARALSRFRRFTDAEINRLGYLGESISHGSPSGVDNTASTYGGLIQFRKGDPPSVERVVTNRTLHVVWASTGITASTSKVLADVNALRLDEGDASFGRRLERYLDVFNQGLDSIQSGDDDALRVAMNQNHALLQDLTVSCDALDQLVAVAYDAGAIGAKMTGTGRGGLIVAIAPSASVQSEVMAALEAVTPTVWSASI